MRSVRPGGRSSPRDALLSTRCGNPINPPLVECDFLRRDFLLHTNPQRGPLQTMPFFSSSLSLIPFFSFSSSIHPHHFMFFSCLHFARVTGETVYFFYYFPRSCPTVPHDQLSALIGQIQPQPGSHWQDFLSTDLQEASLLLLPDFFFCCVGSTTLILFFQPRSEME